MLDVAGFGDGAGDDGDGYDAMVEQRSSGELRSAAEQRATMGCALSCSGLVIIWASRRRTERARR